MYLRVFALTICSLGYAVLDPLALASVLNKAPIIASYPKPVAVFFSSRHFHTVASILALKSTWLLLVGTSPIHARTDF